MAKEQRMYLILDAQNKWWATRGTFEEARNMAAAGYIILEVSGIWHASNELKVKKDTIASYI